ASGGVQPNLNLSMVRSIPVAFPPANEQSRILDEVDKLLSPVDSILLAVEHSDARLTILRQQIRQVAFEGRLVDQDPTDDPASVLLERIRAGWSKAASSSERPRHR